MDQQSWSMTVWVVAASILGFGTSAVFAGWMKLSRHRFLVPYVALAGGFLFFFIRWNEIDVKTLLVHNWAGGILLGGLVSALLVFTVRSQPVSRQAVGGELVFDLAWAGFVYGLVDALFLNVMPVLAVWAGTSQFAWSTTLPGKVGLSVIGLLASLLVTMAYHLGYPEFRGKSIGLVLAGNGVITLAYLVSGNPLGSIISHTAMHVAAVLQGPETTIQLPPHYSVGRKTV